MITYKKVIALLAGIGMSAAALCNSPADPATEKTIEQSPRYTKATATMQKTTLTLPKKTLVGITARTNNATESDESGLKGRIWPCVQRYFGGQLANNIPNRSNPGVTLCAYTEYESDHTGDYTYFIGEEVTSVDASTLPEGLAIIEVPAQTYVKFTTDPGDMPAVIRNAWFEIWSMDDKAFGDTRSYRTDFELYDERAATPDHRGIVLDIFIGIE